MDETVYNDLKEKLLTHDHIGIMLSGGLDSAIFFYCLMTVREQEKLTDTKITVFTVDVAMGAKKDAGAILDFINQTFDSAIEQVIVGESHRKLHPNLMVWSGMADAYTQVDCLTLADNQVPDVPGLIDDPWCPPRKTLDPKDYDSDLPVIDSYRPWIELTKDKTVKIAIDMGLTELFKLTRTCCVDKYKRCGECWYCRERAWAFTQNNYIDPGTR